jgi:hypothetical protein
MTEIASGIGRFQAVKAFLRKRDYFYDPVSGRRSDAHPSTTRDNLMEITSSMGASFHTATPAAQASVAAQESSESMRGPDNDADRDDQITVQSTTRTPSVNAMGETVGQLLDVTA